MKILSNLIIVLACTSLFMALTVNMNFWHSWRLKQFYEAQAKADAEHIRWQSLSEDEKIAEEIDRARKDNTKLSETNLTVTIYGPHRTTPRKFTHCSNVKISGNYCAFTSKGEDYEFPYCEYEIPVDDIRSWVSPSILSKEEKQELMEQLKTESATIMSTTL